MGHALDEEKDDRGTVCVKYLLFLFNFFFWIGGAAVIAMGLWTLLEKSSYIAFLANSTLSVSAYILLFAGGVVMITGFLGCCALIREHKTCLSIYLAILISVYTAELAAGVLSYIYYETFRCCGSTSYEDWHYSLYISTAVYGGHRKVPDSCCKTMTVTCGEREHPSNIYKVEGGCITILQEFIQEHLLLIGAVSIGIACFQLAGVMLSACFLHILYKEEKEAYNTI